jgi:hypothetical protein
VEAAAVQRGTSLRVGTETPSRAEAFRAVIHRRDQLENSESVPRNRIPVFPGPARCRGVPGVRHRPHDRRPGRAARRRGPFRRPAALKPGREPVGTAGPVRVSDVGGVAKLSGAGSRRAAGAQWRRHPSGLCTAAGRHSSR